MQPGPSPDTHALRVVAWETTRRCPLRCRHCRGAARDRDYEGELSTAEGVKLIDSIASFAKPILILTGGEPMARPDVYDLARHAADRGLHVAMSPCGPMITAETARLIKASGVRRISVSLDGASARAHDDFRGVTGSFEAALRGIGHARDAGVEFQINTTVTRNTLPKLQAILDMATELGAAALDLFFLVPVGRGEALKDLAISPGECERALNWIYEKSLTSGIALKVTCAPHYQRVRLQRAQAEGRADAAPGRDGRAATKGCLGGRGFVFVSHTGVVQVCGFLEVPCGELRAEDFDFRKIYETSAVFRKVRSIGERRGKCAVCEYRAACGGCRARAYARTGDYLGEEPSCAYVPGATKEAADGRP